MTRLARILLLVMGLLSLNPRTAAVPPASGTGDWVWFPDTFPPMAPYLVTLDQFGTSAMAPGPMIPSDPVSRLGQGMKTRLGSVGFEYNFYQSLSLVDIPRPVTGLDALVYYTTEFQGKWVVARSPGGTGLGLSLAFTGQEGLTRDSHDPSLQSPQINFGSLSNPQANVTGMEGYRLAEIAAQISSPHGDWILLLGMVDQGNYIDSNSYANNSQTQFLNDALVNNATIPLPEANLGFNLQWQPTRQFYLLMGAGSNLQIPKQAVVLSLGAANWSYLLELGLITTNTFGLGPGIYRVQPFVATVHSDTQGGVGLNFQQDLGVHTPIAAFGRLGVCGNQIAFENIRAQGSLGLALTGPIDAPGPIPLFSNDMLGLAFVWSQALPDGFPVYRPNEYNIELFYSVQITPTLKLQPDLQVFWDAADRPQSGVSLLWQLQLTLTW